MEPTTSNSSLTEANPLAAKRSDLTSEERRTRQWRRRATLAALLAFLAAAGGLALVVQKVRAHPNGMQAVVDPARTFPVGKLDPEHSPTPEVWHEIASQPWWWVCGAVALAGAVTSLVIQVRHEDHRSASSALLMVAMSIALSIGAMAPGAAADQSSTFPDWAQGRYGVVVQLPDQHGLFGESLPGYPYDGQQLLLRDGSRAEVTEVVTPGGEKGIIIETSPGQELPRVESPSFLIHDTGTADSERTGDSR